MSIDPWLGTTRLNPLDAYSGACYKITRAMFTELLDRLDTFTDPSTIISHSIPRQFILRFAFSMA